MLYSIACKMFVLNGNLSEVATVEIPYASVKSKFFFVLVWNL